MNRINALSFLELSGPMKFGELRLTTTSLLFLFATSAINGFTNSDENNLSQSQEEELTIVGGASANDDYNCGLSNMGLPGRRVGCSITNNISENNQIDLVYFIFTVT